MSFVFWPLIFTQERESLACCLPKRDNFGGKASYAFLFLFNHLMRYQNARPNFRLNKYSLTFSPFLFLFYCCAFTKTSDVPFISCSISSLPVPGTQTYDLSFGFDMTPTHGLQIEGYEDQDFGRDQCVFFCPDNHLKITNLLAVVKTDF